MLGCAAAACACACVCVCVCVGIRQSNGQTPVGSSRTFGAIIFQIRTRMRFMGAYMIVQDFDPVWSCYSGASRQALICLSQEDHGSRVLRMMQRMEMQRIQRLKHCLFTTTCQYFANNVSATGVAAVHDVAFQEKAQFPQLWGPDVHASFCSTFGIMLLARNCVDKREMGHHFLMFIPQNYQERLLPKETSLHWPYWNLLMKKSAIVKACFVRKYLS